MSPTDLTTALNEVRDAVEVPPVDRVAFQARVRAERRRRTTTRAAGAVAGLAATAAVVAGGAHLSLGDGATPVASAPTLAVDEPTEIVGFVLQGRLVVGGPGGFTETDIPARNVLGVLAGRLVQADYRGALVAVPVDPDGAPGAAERLASVLRVHLDRAGGRVVAEGEDGRYRIWEAATGAWTDLDVPPAVGDFVVATDGEHRVDSGPDGFTLRDSADLVRVLPFRGGVIGWDLKVGVLAVETHHGVRFFDAASGRQLSRAGGQGMGAISPDGRSYARGWTSGVNLVDPQTGRRTPVEVDVPGAEVVWTGAETFVVVGRQDDGTKVLQECDAVRRTCRILYEDPTDTLSITP